MKITLIIIITLNDGITNINTNNTDTNLINYDINKNSNDDIAKCP